MTTSLEKFLALVRNDAAVQERVVAASKAEQPVAAAAGFQLTADDVKSVFNPELGNAELDHPASGHTCVWMSVSIASAIRLSARPMALR